MFKSLPDIICKGDVFEMNGVGVERKPSEYRVLDRDRLLINFLEHEMLVAALFRHDRVPRDVLKLRLPSVSGRIQQAYAVTRDDSHLVIVEKQDGARIGKHCRHIRGDESFAVHGPDDQRISFADRDDLLWIVDTDARERIQTLQLGECLDHSILKTPLEMFFEKMRDNFGVGFGGEFVALFDEFPLQSEIILDDAVMRNNDAPFAIAMGMSILFRGASVGRPTRMPEPELPRHGLLLEQLLEIFEFAGTPPDPELLAFDDCDSRGVVPAVLQRSKPSHDDRNRITWPDVAENPTHGRRITRLTWNCCSGLMN